IAASRVRFTIRARPFLSFARLLAFAFPASTPDRRTAMIRSLTRLATIAVLAAATASCALSLHNPNISDLQRHPARYQDRTVSVSGVVTSSWGLPLVPFRMYKVDDGTGQVTIISPGFRPPAPGEHVRVKRRVGDLAILGGRPLGLHLREESLYVSR